MQCIPAGCIASRVRPVVDGPAQGRTVAIDPHRILNRHDKGVLIGGKTGKPQGAALFGPVVRQAGRPLQRHLVHATLPVGGIVVHADEGAGLDGSTVPIHRDVRQGELRFRDTLEHDDVTGAVRTPQDSAATLEGNRGGVLDMLGLVDGEGDTGLDGHRPSPSIGELVPFPGRVFADSQVVDSLDRGPGSSISLFSLSKVVRRKAEQGNGERRCQESDGEQGRTTGKMPFPNTVHLGSSPCWNLEPHPWRFRAL